MHGTFPLSRLKESLSLSLSLCTPTLLYPFNNAIQTSVLSRSDPGPWSSWYLYPANLGGRVGVVVARLTCIHNAMRRSLVQSGYVAILESTMSFSLSFLSLFSLFLGGILSHGESNQTQLELLKINDSETLNLNTLCPSPRRSAYPAEQASNCQGTGISPSTTVLVTYPHKRFIF